jgi:hypothetical protein
VLSFNHDGVGIISDDLCGMMRIFQHQTIISINVINTTVIVNDQNNKYKKCISGDYLN